MGTVVKLLDRIEKALIVVGSLSGIATLLMVLTILPDVLSRNFFGMAIEGVSEVNVALLIVLVFAGLAGAQAQSAHFRLSLIDSLLGPGPALRVVRIVGTLIALATFSVVLEASAKHALAATKRGEYQFGLVEFPIWPLRIVIAVGFLLLIVQLLIDLIRLLRGEDRQPAAQGEI